MQTLERLSQFRQQLYQTFTRRAMALLEVIDAVGFVGLCCVGLEGGGEVDDLAAVFG